MKHSPIYYLRHFDRVFNKVLSSISPSYALRQDRIAIENIWKSLMDYPLNLKDPKTFCEKIQWIKLYDRNPLYHKLVDKYEVKKWVADRIGEKHVVKCYGIWNSIDEIDFNTLPDAFVLKCTHSSGGITIVKDKSKLNIEEVREKIEPFLYIKSWYNAYKEWAYKDVPARIIAEEYIDSLGDASSVEYKINCMNGEVKLIRVCSGIAHGDNSQWFIDCYSKNGDKIPISIQPAYEEEWYVSSGTSLPSAEITKELIEIAETLSTGIPHVRVDLYVHKGIVMFGEMTFYPHAGFLRFNPKELDRTMGDWINLPNMK